jgi:hypothetical protein
METEKTKRTIMQLSELCDLIGLRTYIVNKTRYGKKPGKEPWSHTRAALAAYAPNTDPHEMIKLFESVGCKNEIEAVRWLLKHDELVP